MRQMSRAARGFTFIELLVTLAIGAMVLAFGLPGLIDFIANNRATTQANEVLTTFLFARNAAVTRPAPVTICAVNPSNSAQCASGGGPFNWDKGWLVFVDNGVRGTIDGGDAVLRAYPALTGGTLTANVASVQYRIDGFLEAGSTTLALRVAHCKLDNNRNISLSAQGRPSVAHAAC
jgi:type IV fimbrial biogenesis protein FimT